MIRGDADWWNSMAQEGLTHLERLTVALAALVERAVVALERSAEAQEAIANRLDNMHAGYVDVRVVRDHD
jgi:hypothetical protein